MKTNDLILQTVTKIATFIIILFSINIFFAGHYTPGGGFIGGLMTSSAIILLLLAFDLKTVKSFLPVNYLSLVAVGLLLSVGTGAGALFFDAPFLTHAFDYFDLPL